MTKLKIFISLSLGLAVLFNGASSTLAQTCPDVVGGVDYCPLISGGTRCTIYGTMPSCGSTSSEITPAANTALNCDACTFSCASGWVDCDGNIRSNGCERANPIGGACTLGGQSGTYTGNPCGPTCTITPRYVSRQYSFPGTAEEGYINVKGNARIAPKDDNTEGNLYLSSDKAVRVDSSGDTQLNIGNWGGGSLNLKIFGNLTPDSITLGGVRKTAWPEESQWLSSGSDIYYSAGNVGIGTNDPRFNLHVVGNAEIQGVLGVTDGLSVTGDGITGSGNINLRPSPLGVLLDGADRPLITRGFDAFASGNYKGAGRWGLFMEPGKLTIGTPNIASNGKIQFARYNADSTVASVSMYIDENGRVGIGTTAPSAKLHVKGTRSDDAVVYLEPAPWTSGSYGELKFGDSFHTIRGEHSRGMVFNDVNKYVFRGGNVRIGATSDVTENTISGFFDGPVTRDAKLDVWGEFGTTPAVRGLSFSGDGVVGRSQVAGRSGVYGYNSEGFGVYGRSKSITQAGVGAENKGADDIAGNGDDGPALKLDGGKLQIRAVEGTVGGIYVITDSGELRGRVIVNGVAGRIYVPRQNMDNDDKTINIEVVNTYVTPNSLIFLTPSNPRDIDGGFPSFGGINVTSQTDGSFWVRQRPINNDSYINFLVIN